MNERWEMEDGRWKNSHRFDAGIAHLFLSNVSLMVWKMEDRRWKNSHRFDAGIAHLFFVKRITNGVEDGRWCVFA